MATAKIEREMAARGEGILHKCADDEPVFILRAKDVFAHECIRSWIAAAHDSNRVSAAKIDEAKALLQALRDWQITYGKIKYPD